MATPWTSTSTRGRATAWTRPHVDAAPRGRARSAHPTSRTGASYRRCRCWCNVPFVRKQPYAAHHSALSPRQTARKEAPGGGTEWGRAASKRSTCDVPRRPDDVSCMPRLERAYHKRAQLRDLQAVRDGIHPPVQLLYRSHLRAARTRVTERCHWGARLGVHAPHNRVENVPHVTDAY